MEGDAPNTRIFPIPINGDDPNTRILPIPINGGDPNTHFLPKSFHAFYSSISAINIQFKEYWR
ncbi:MAG: hypothetical protein WCH34_02330 [Bacteroidota bacterium]